MEGFSGKISSEVGSQEVDREKTEERWQKREVGRREVVSQ